MVVSDSMMPAVFPCYATHSVHNVVCWWAWHPRRMRNTCDPYIGLYWVSHPPSRRWVNLRPSMGNCQRAADSSQHDTMIAQEDYDAPTADGHPNDHGHASSGRVCAGAGASVGVGYVCCAATSRDAHDDDDAVAYDNARRSQSHPTDPHSWPWRDYSDRTQLLHF